ncbi:MAG TPA: HtaA domain-containing protein [Solirubrobacterales bacterium]|nr:HtaA domain-containing protein [Solirubrobacterales bacterium]
MAGFVALCAFWLAPAPAGAATLTPCVATPPPTGPVTELDGTATIELKSAVKRKLRADGVRMALEAPANNFTGRPSFPVASVEYGEATSRIGLGGALALRGKKSKRLSFTGMAATIRPKGDSVITARFGGGSKKLFTVKGGKVTRDTASGELYLKNGRAALTGTAAKAIRKRFGLKKYRALKNGLNWGPVNLYSLYKVTTPPKDPEAETPVEPPVATKPAGATDLSSATIEWRVRDSFIRYVSSGDGAGAVDGAIPGPAEAVDGATPLVYNFSFPFTSGWTDPVTDSSLIKGSGGVTFRYCRNTINFVVHDPEIELNGDLSRMIFRVQGTDGTAFPDSRAVMVGLRLNQAESVQIVGNTTTYTKIPGFVPEGSSGIFADFYMPGADFGHLTISLTTP